MTRNRCPKPQWVRLGSQGSLYRALLFWSEINESAWKFSSTVAILAQGTSWAVAVTQAFWICPPEAPLCGAMTPPSRAATPHRGVTQFNEALIKRKRLGRFFIRSLADLKASPPKIIQCAAYKHVRKTFAGVHGADARARNLKNGTRRGHFYRSFWQPLGRATTRTMPESLHVKLRSMAQIAPKVCAWHGKVFIP